MVCCPCPTSVATFAIPILLFIWALFEQPIRQFLGCEVWPWEVKPVSREAKETCCSEEHEETEEETEKEAKKTL